MTAVSDAPARRARDRGEHPSPSPFRQTVRDVSAPAAPSAGSLAHGPAPGVAGVPTSARATGPWLRGPAWDGVWMLSALWLVPAVLLLAHGHADAEKSPVDTLYFGLTVLFWIGHRIGSTWLAYGTTAYRPLLRVEPRAIRRASPPS